MINDHKKGLVISINELKELKFNSYEKTLIKYKELNKVSQQCINYFLRYTTIQ